MPSLLASLYDHMIPYMIVSIASFFNNGYLFDADSLVGRRRARFDVLPFIAESQSAQSSTWNFLVEEAAITIFGDVFDTRSGLVKTSTPTAAFRWTSTANQQQCA
jgi:hypothetical protein